MDPANGTKKTKTESCGCSGMPQERKTTMPAMQSNQPQSLAACSVNATKPNQTNSTKITIKYNCGFPNNLFIRGEGVPGLNWDHGVALKNVKSDEWTWETDKPFTKGQIKILLNDRVYEKGTNHALECGKPTTLNPQF